MSGLPSCSTFLECPSLGNLELADGLVNQPIVEPVSYSFALAIPILSPGPFLLLLVLAVKEQVSHLKEFPQVSAGS